MSIPLAPRALRDLAARHGGTVTGESSAASRSLIRRLAPVEHAGAFELAPVLAPRYASLAKAALERGASLLVDAKLVPLPEVDAEASGALWVHPFAAFALAELLRHADLPNEPAVIGEGCNVHPTALLFPRVRLGKRVRVGPYCVIGADGFAFAHGPNGEAVQLPHGGGVVLEDDVHLGSHVTIDAGTFAPTRVGRGCKIDSHVHLGHNVEVGEGCVFAAQVGVAGSVRFGRHVLVGGQAGFADHVTVGAGAKVAAKSGVIGDVPEGAVVAGYPAVPRTRWLRGVAALYRDADTSSAAGAALGDE